MTDAPPELDDPKLHKQMRAVATIYSRGRPWLREEMASACNFALAKAVADWRPDGGMTFRSYATLIAHHECQEAIRAARPRGFRSKAHRDRDSGPAVLSLEGVAEAGDGSVADFTADPSPGPDALAETRDLAALAAGSLGPDAPIVLRWARGEAAADLAADLGVSRQRIAQKLDRGLGRARKAMGGG